MSRALAERPFAWDLTRLTRDELVELEALARKAEAAQQAGEALVWNSDEEEALARLEAQMDRDGGVPATDTT